jgi:Protein of unknown function (DUF1573)
MSKLNCIFVINKINQPKLNKMKKLFILAVMAIFAVNANAQFKSKPSAPKVEAPISKDPSIFIEKDVVEYGVIAKGSERVRTFKVVNKGAQPLILTNCSGSCGCTVPTCPREPILPGKSAEISVNYDTNREGPFEKQVNIASNDPSTPNKAVRIKGEVKVAPTAP